MGQDVSHYTDHLPAMAVLPHVQQLTLQIHRLRLKHRFRFHKDGLDIERELRKWLSPGKHKNKSDKKQSEDKEDSSDDDGDDECNSIDDEGDDFDDDGESGDDLDSTLEEGDVTTETRLHVGSYEHYRTRIGSPSINRRSFTDVEMKVFQDENDGFPLPSTQEDLRAFDKHVFIETSEVKVATRKRPKKRDRQRSKSATAVPDLSTIRLKLQKIQSPSKPKFLEHLINRVVSRKVGKSEGNGLIPCLSEPCSSDAPEQTLSPDSEKCLQHAEAIVEELLACSARPPSGDSSDSGKGSLLESTTDFSPTNPSGVPPRRSWSTPASPTFQGIVKERLKSFQALREDIDVESIGSDPDVAESISARQRSGSKSYKSEEFELEIKEINKNIKTFYTALSNDESFNSAVMESGYVKALVAKINEHKLKEEEETTGELDDNEVENEDDVSDILKLNISINKEDSGWSEWEHEHEGEATQDSEESTQTTPDCTKPASRCSSRSSVNGVELRSGNATPTGSARNSTSSSVSAHSSHSHGNSLRSSRHNSASDNSESHDEDERPKDRLEQIATELLTTERAYVKRLHLLDQVFNARVAEENQKSNYFPAEVVTQMFSKVQPIYTFHNDFLLPQLEDRMKNWSKEHKIGDIMAKLAPFLLLYTEYVKNYDNAMATIDKWTSQSPKFAALLQEIQMLPECGSLTLQHHMLGPIQRVPRYELLLKDYLKHLAQDAVDRKDAQRALDLVTQAACHSNTAMKKLDKFNKLLTIIPKLNGENLTDLVKPTRELVKEGPITKISARNSEKQSRYIFLFNDLLLVCSEQIMGSYKVRAQLSVENGMQVLPGENMAIANTFCVKCVEKNIEFLDEANNGKGQDWFATFQQVITDFHSKAKLSRVMSSENSDRDNAVNGGVDENVGHVAPVWVKDESVSMCMSCQDKFTKIKRRHHCRACGQVFCNKCTSSRAFIPYEKKENRVCRSCYSKLTKDSDGEQPKTTTPSKTVNKRADLDSVMAGYVNIMDKDKKWTRRWIVVHDDFAMYFYKKHKDPKAIQTLPIPGHAIRVLGDSADRANVIALMHKDIIVCHFQADSEEEMNQWVKVLDKMSRLELPDSEPKRMSTHSDSSSQSNQSTSSSTDQSTQS